MKRSIRVSSMASSSAKSPSAAPTGDDICAALARADFYPSRADHVDVRETVVSWVFLAGDRAYKLKKQLVLPFLDYGTPERRRAMCREEVRLNRRLASDLYLGVRAVAAGAHGLELAPEDDPRATYAELGHRAAKEAAVCGGALVDATFRHRVDRQALAEPFGDAAPLLFVECRAPVEVLAERAARRDREPRRVSDASLSVVVRESSTWEPLDELPAEAHVTLRTDRRVEAQLEDLRALLDRRIGRLRIRRDEPPSVAELANP
jgi:predicted kinase